MSYQNEIQYDQNKIMKPVRKILEYTGNHKKKEYILNIWLFFKIEQFFFQWEKSRVYAMPCLVVFGVWSTEHQCFWLGTGKVSCF